MQHHAASSGALGPGARCARLPPTPVRPAGDLARPVGRARGRRLLRRGHGEQLGAHLPHHPLHGPDSWTPRRGGVPAPAEWARRRLLGARDHAARRAATRLLQRPAEAGPQAQAATASASPSPPRPTGPWRDLGQAAALRRATARSTRTLTRDERGRLNLVFKEDGNEFKGRRRSSRSGMREDGTQPDRAAARAVPQHRALGGQGRRGADDRAPARRLLHALLGQPLLHAQVRATRSGSRGRRRSSAAGRSSPATRSSASGNGWRCPGHAGLVRRRRASSTPTAPGRAGSTGRQMLRAKLTWRRRRLAADRRRPPGRADPRAPRRRSPTTAHDRRAQEWEFPVRRDPAGPHGRRRRAAHRRRARRAPGSMAAILARQRHRRALHRPRVIVAAATCAARPRAASRPTAAASRRSASPSPATAR